MLAITIRRAVLAISLAALAAPVAEAQVRRRPTSPDGLLWPVIGGLSAIQMRPYDEFGRNIGFGYGAEGTGAVGLDPWGVVKLRATFGGVWYGNEYHEARLSPTISGRITVNVVTNNVMYFGNIGPEISVPWGPVRPYYHAGIGFQYFTTNSHLEDDNDSESHFETHNYDDGTKSHHEGVGVRIAVVPYTHRVPIMVDLGMTRYTGGHARYLRPGSIVDNYDGSITITPLESAIHFRTWRIGVTVGR